MNFSLINELILAILLGIVQGITEFLPISSTAHLRLVSGLLLQGKDIGLTTSNIIQLGTLIAIIQYFWSDLKVYAARFKDMIVNPSKIVDFNNNFQTWWTWPSAEEIEKYPELKTDLAAVENDPEFKLDATISQLLVGSVPLIIAGFLLSSVAEGTRSLMAIAGFLLAGSILMGFAERIYHKAKTFPKTGIISRGEVLLIGLFQVLAIFPGISRSGATLSGALFLGRDKAESVRFSFLLSIPALGLAGLKDLVGLFFHIKNNGIVLWPSQQAWAGSLVELSILSIVVSFVLAYVLGLICLRWLLKYLSSHSFKNFIIYRVILAIVIIVVARLWF